MAVTVFTETMHPGAFLVSELDEYASRDQVTIDNSQTIVVGAVLGKTTVIANSTCSTVADASNTGNGTVTQDASTPVLANAIDGTYRAVCIAIAANSGTFAVFDPNGVEIGRVAVAATFSNQIKFVIADGGTDWAAGDAISFIVGIEYEGDERFRALNYAGTAGENKAVAIAMYPATTAGGTTAQITVIQRNAQVRLADLTFPSGTAAQKAEAIDQLRAVGIICR